MISLKELNKTNPNIMLQAMVGVVGREKTNAILEHYQELENEIIASGVCCRCQENVHTLKQHNTRLEIRVGFLEKMLFE